MYSLNNSTTADGHFIIQHNKNNRLAIVLHSTQGDYVLCNINKEGYMSNCKRFGLLKTAQMEFKYS